MVLFLHISADTLTQCCALAAVERACVSRSQGVLTTDDISGSACQWPPEANAWQRESSAVQCFNDQVVFKHSSEDNVSAVHESVVRAKVSHELIERPNQ